MRPSFAKDFPRTPELDALVNAFVQGDYAFVRDAGRALTASSGDESIRRAARVLIERTDPDPIAVALLVIAALVLLALGGFWMAFGKAPHPLVGEGETWPPRSFPAVALEGATAFPPTSRGALRMARAEPSERSAAWLG